MPRPPVHPATQTRAPLRPGGSWLALKAVPLALAWVGCLHGRLRAWRLALLMLPFFFAEAAVAMLTRSGRAQFVAGWAALLAAVCFAATWLLPENRGSFYLSHEHASPRGRMKATRSSTSPSSVTMCWSRARSMSMKQSRSGWRRSRVC